MKQSNKNTPKVNKTKIIQTIQKNGYIEFNHYCSITKLETNVYIVHAPTYTQNESGIDTLDLNELHFFIDKHSSIFIDIFDSAAYKKENYNKSNIIDHEVIYNDKLLNHGDKKEVAGPTATNIIYDFTDIKNPLTEFQKIMCDIKARNKALFDCYLK